MNSIAQYLSEIGKYKLLTPDEELALGRLVKEDHDATAREVLINCNLRLVVSIAKSYKSDRNNLSIEDLIAYGNCGLITAVDKYDYTKGFRFSTCAVPWIKQAISKGIADNSRVIRIPAHIIQLFNKEKAAREALEKELETEPADIEIADKMGITLEELNALHEWKRNSVSLSSPLGDDSEDTLEDISCDEDAETPADLTEKHMLHDAIIGLLKPLDARTKTIVKLRFGLAEPGDDEMFTKEHTLEEIGALLTPHITRERVRQILVGQLAKWKTTLKDFEF